MRMRIMTHKVENVHRSNVHDQLTPLLGEKSLPVYLNHPVSPVHLGLGYPHYRYSALVHLFTHPTNSGCLLVFIYPTKMMWYPPPRFYL